MTKLFALFLLMLTAYSAAIDQDQLSTTQMQLLEEVKGSQWGQMIITMADISAASDGILQELVDAIEGLLVELDDTLAKIEADYQLSQNNYNKKKRDLSLAIDDCAIDLGAAADQLDGVLVPNKNQLEVKLKELEQDINDNRGNLQRETLERNKAHNNFMEKVSEQGDAINSIDECIGLMESLITSSEFVETSQNRYKESVKKIQKNVDKKQTFSPLVKSIMDLTANFDYKDVQTAKSLVDTFNQLRNMMVDDMNRSTSDEHDAQEQFEKRLDALENEYNEFQRSATDATYQQSSIQTEIEAKNDYIKQRKEDKELLDEQNQENEDWMAQETNLYTQLKNTYQRELEAASQAHSLVSSSDFVNYVKAKGGI